jgi:hypothetical protein
MSSLYTSTLIALIVTVRKEDMAVATGISYLFRTTGQVIGVSLSGALTQAIVLRQLRARITGPDSADIINTIRHSIASIPNFEPAIRDAAVASYADATRAVFICQSALAFMMLVACLPIQENFLPGTREEQEEQFRRNAETSGNTSDEENA